jgi:hypothetical protein
MGVIINDFEVVVETPSEATPGETAAPPPPPQALTPQDIQNLIRHQLERSSRIRAD